MFERAKQYVALKVAMILSGESADAILEDIEREIENEGELDVLKERLYSSLLNGHGYSVPDNYFAENIDGVERKGVLVSALPHPQGLSVFFDLRMSPTELERPVKGLLDAECSDGTYLCYDCDVYLQPDDFEKGLARVLNISLFCEKAILEHRGS